MGRFTLAKSSRLGKKILRDFCDTAIRFLPKMCDISTTSDFPKCVFYAEAWNLVELEKNDENNYRLVVEMC